MYFFVGGAAGAAAIVATVAAAAGAEAATVADARLIAAVGGAISPLLLVSDLGRPSRFLNMLRVFKHRSPMSVGAWTLVVFSSAAVLTLLLHTWITDWPRVAATADVVAAIAGAGLATYTGVLIGATAIPVWARHAGVLPLHFGTSGMAVAVSLLELVGHRAPALNRLGIGAALIETVLLVKMERARDPVARSVLDGTSGWLVRVGAWLTGPAALFLRLAGLAAPVLRLAAAVSMTTGSLVTRFGWIAAGRRSAGDRAAVLGLDT